MKIIAADNTIIATTKESEILHLNDDLLIIAVNKQEVGSISFDKLSSATVVIINSDLKLAIDFMASEKALGDHLIFRIYLK